MLPPPAIRQEGKHNKTIQYNKMKTHVKKGDTVEVITGKSKGKRGAVLSINLKKQTVIVEGARTVKKAMKPTESDPEGGVKEIDGSIHISNVKKVN